MKKRWTVLLTHSLRRWRNDRLGEQFHVWRSYIQYCRRIAQALDRTTDRRRYLILRATFFGWCETMADERRSRWLASRVLIALALKKSLSLATHLTAIRQKDMFIGAGREQLLQAAALLDNGLLED